MTGIVRNGKLEIDLPLSVAEGTAIQVWVNTIDDDGPMSPEEIARTPKATDEFEALFPVEEDGEDFRKVAREDGEAYKQQFFNDAERLRKLFD